MLPATLIGSRQPSCVHIKYSKRRTLKRTAFVQCQDIKLKALVQKPKKNGSFREVEGWRGEGNPLDSGLQAPPSPTHRKVQIYTTKTYVYICASFSGIQSNVSGTVETRCLEQYTNQKPLQTRCFGLSDCRFLQSSLYADEGIFISQDKVDIMDTHHNKKYTSGILFASQNPVQQGTRVVTANHTIYT